MNGQIFKNFIKYLFSTSVFLVFLFTPFFASAAPTCKVEPFSTTLLQGTEKTVKLYVEEIPVGSGVAITTGNPVQILRPIKVSDVSLFPTYAFANLHLQAIDEATPGSYSVPVSVKMGEEETVCIFNLRTEYNTELHNRLSASSAGFNQSPSVDEEVQNTEEENQKKLEEKSTTTPQILETETSIKPGALLQITRTLYLGSFGDDVEELQKFLQSLGFFPESQKTTKYFGPITEAALKKYQEANGLEPAGRVGPKTRALLASGSSGSEAVGETTTTGEASKPKITKTLKLKMWGEDVRLLQEILQKAGFFPTDISPTGYFGSVTEGAVKKYQESKGIEAIGIVGPKTRSALNAE